ncbi:MAG: cell division protein FtsQ/DivIB [Trebonia sp.]
MMRVRWRAAFFVLAGAGIVAAVAWALLGSRLFVVRSIAVSGTHRVSSSEVAGIADVPLGTPLSRVDTAVVARRIETIKQVASASVSTSWPDGLDIAVRERTPAVTVRMARGYDVVDATGVVLSWSAAKPASLPVYVTSVTGADLRGDARLSAAAAVLAELPKWLSRSVDSVSAAGSASSAGPVTLDLRHGKTVVWGGTDRATEKARELAILIGGQATYYDVSAPGTAVTR